MHQQLLKKTIPRAHNREMSKEILDIHALAHEGSTQVKKSNISSWLTSMSSSICDSIRRLIKCLKDFKQLLATRGHWVKIMTTRIMSEKYGDIVSFSFLSCHVASITRKTKMRGERRWKDQNGEITKKERKIKASFG